MTDSNLTRSPSPLGPARQVALRSVAGLATLLLRWRPEGCLTLALPGGERIRLGRGNVDVCAELAFRTWSSLRRCITGGTLGFAEAYIAGDVRTPDLGAFFRFCLLNRDRINPPRLGFGSARALLEHRSRRNTKDGSRRNIVEHYDLGNAFFRKWLDDSMSYSSGLYASDDEPLEDAQRRKVDRILDLADAEAGAEMLEIGSGWGALARAAAERGAGVTGITLSDEQLAWAREQARTARLTDRLSFRLQDYRDTAGTYDRILSVEMIEAVGEEYWPVYFRRLRELLKPGGRAVIQAITIEEERYADYRANPDFIQRYVFPGGMLPTVEAIREQVSAAGLVWEFSETFGRSYALTLREWRRRFEAAWPQISRLGFDEAFRRRWRYYLAYCEAGFLDGTIDVGIYTFRRA